MTKSDWLYVIEVDASKAETKLDSFTKKAKTLLDTIPSIKINVDSQKVNAAEREIARFSKSARHYLTSFGDVKLTVDSRNALSQINEVGKLAQSLTKNRYNTAITASNDSALSAIRQVKSELVGIQGGRISIGGLGSSGGSYGISSRSTLSSVTREAEAQTRAVDFLTKAWSYSMLKFMEYEVISKSVEGTIHGLSNSLKEASDIQFEQTMQRLYSPSTFSTPEKQALALERATSIARQWGSNITDVLQVQGLWTKQTNDLTAATYLADRAEQMHRASGIDTIEVYEKSIAMASQLGITLDQLPKVYDQIAEAALKVAVPMNNFEGKSGRREAMKDLLEGAAKGMATFKSMGFVDKGDAAAGSIAIVANQLQATGDGAKEAAKNLTSMFAALEGGGKHRRNIEAILGDPSKFKNFDEVIQKFIDKAPELRQALANGELGVRPAQVESLQTFLASLKEIIKLHDDITKNSKGKLSDIAEAEMETLKGQLDRVKASAQQFGIALGTQVLPDAMQFLHFLNGSLPALSQHAAGLAQLGRAAITLGEAYLATQVMQRAWLSGSSAFQKLNADMDAVVRAQRTVAVTAEEAKLAYMNLYAVQAPLVLQTGALRIAEADNIQSMQAEMDQMEKEKAVLADLKAQKELLAWRTGEASRAASEFGKTEQEVADIALASRSKFSVMAEGINMIGMAALRQIGPLALMAAAIQGLDALDKDKNAQLGLQLGFMNQGTFTAGGQRSKFITEALHAPQIDIALALGKGNEFNAYSREEQNILKYGQGFEAEDVRTQYRTRMRAMLQARTYQREKEEYQSQWDKLHPFGGMYTSDKDSLARQQSLSGFDTQIERAQRASDIASEQEAKSIIAIIRKHENLTSPEGREMEALRKQAEAVLHGTTVGSATSPLPATQDQTKAASAEDILRHNIEQTKRDYSAAMTAAADLAESRHEDIETIKKQGETTGWTASIVKQLQNAYHGEENALQRKANAAKAELGPLAQEIILAEQQVNATKAGTKAREQANFNLSAARDAYLKAAEGANKLAEAVKLARAEEALDVQNARINAELKAKAWGFSGPVPTNMEGYRSFAQEQIRAAEAARKMSGITGERGVLQSAIPQVTALRDFIAQEEKLHPGSTALQQLFKTLSEGLTELQGKLAETTPELQKLADQAMRIGQSAALKNGEGAAEALGLDKKSINSVKDYIEQLNSITDARERLQEELKTIGTGQDAEATHARDMIAFSEQQLDIQQRMLPIIEQHRLIEDDIAKIRKSAAYESLNKSFMKEGDTLLSDLIKSRFQESTNSTFGVKFGGRPTKSGGVISGFMQDYLKSTGEEAIKSVSGHLMDAIFKVDKLKSQDQQNNEYLKKVYETAVSGQLTAAQLQAQAGKDQLEAANIVTGKTSTSSGFTYGPPGELAKGRQSGADASFAGALAISANVLGDIGKSTKATAWNTDVNGNPTGLAAAYADKMEKITTGGADKYAGGFGAIGGFFGKTGTSFSDEGQGFKLGNIMQGMSEGTMASSLFGTSGPWGEILGGVGGAFGPVGAAAGALLGGLIGPHWGPATNTPDRSNPAYGQWLANMTGTEQLVNGLPVDPSKQYNTYLGYQSESTQLANMVNSASMVQEMTPALKAFANNLKGLENAAGGGLNIVSEHNGIATLGSGKTVNVQDYMNWTNQLEAYQQDMQGRPIAPIIGINAYGAGGGLMPSTTSNIGLTPQEAQALRLTAYGTQLNPAQGVSAVTPTINPYSTPGVGSAAPGASASQPLYTTAVGNQQPIQVNTQISLDSTVIARMVTAVQTAQANANGLIPA